MEINNFKELGEKMAEKNINYLDFQAGITKADLIIFSQYIDQKINVEITNPRENLFDFMFGYTRHFLGNVVKNQ